MTREEAINTINSLKQYYNDKNEDSYVGFDNEDNEALEIAIEALETASCIKEKCAYCPHCKNCDVDDETLAIKALEQQPKTGRWIFDEILDKHYYCSECKSMGVDYWDYCPNCGADMRGDKE